jgi:hypothetical protein
MGGDISGKESEGVGSRKVTAACLSAIVEILLYLPDIMPTTTVIVACKNGGREVSVMLLSVKDVIAKADDRAQEVGISIAIEADNYTAYTIFLSKAEMV